MLRRLLVGSSILVLSLYVGSIRAQTTVTFDSFAGGTVITNQYPGISISLLGSAPIAGPKTYVLEDTSGVPQFIFGASGNAITAAEIGNFAPFYDIQFAFSQRIDSFSLMAIDAEEPVSGSAYLGNTFISSLALTSIGFNEASVFRGPVYSLDFGAVGGSQTFDRVVIHLDPLGGPELFDNLVYHTTAPIPEPEIYAMLGVGLGLLGWVGRRKKLKEAAVA